jgi:polysaccharide biosynthesis/export protein
MDSTSASGARASHSHVAGLLLGALLLLGGCRHTGPFVWVDDFAPAQPEAAVSGYVIGPGDVLSVRVFNHEGMSTRSRVRSDGRISMPFLKDVVAAGFTPNAFAEQLQVRLKDFINNPVVTVALEESHPLQVPVMGEVVRPGGYALEPGSGVLAALAAAGGLTDYADSTAIYVLRRTPGLQRIRFSYDALTRSDPRAAGFRLQPGDALVVE